MMSFALSMLVALPQLVMSYTLAVRSNRIGVEEDYAYVGSMSPFALFTLLIPTTQQFFRGNSIYGGIFSILLVLYAIFSKKERGTTLFRLWVVIGLISLLLALGEWSPLYVGIVKVTKFYSFRTPMKFLVFLSLLTR